MIPFREAGEERLQASGIWLQASEDLATLKP